MFFLTFDVMRFKIVVFMLGVKDNGKSFFRAIDVILNVGCFARGRVREAIKTWKTMEKQVGCTRKWFASREDPCL